MTNEKPAASAKPWHIGNGLVAVMFLSIGGVNLASGEHLDAGIWIALGLGLGVLGSEATPWAQIPVWRRALGIVLLLAGVGMFIARVWLDIAR
ncbi:MAG: hypothetical protein H7124_13150 [Phycisphaerales bacterium]|nr:hypothetical protein [Hyphomonadaceae bacterium]